MDRRVARIMPVIVPQIETYFEPRETSRARFEAYVRQSRTEDVVLLYQEICLACVTVVIGNSLSILLVVNNFLDRANIWIREDRLIRHTLELWRRTAGHIKNVLRQQLCLVQSMLRGFPDLLGLEFYDLNLVVDKKSRKFIDRAETLRDEVTATSTRLDTTFSSIMSTMSIIESQKAISQAEGVAKLTSLAFFYIPLTFVAGIFGMNLTLSCTPSDNLQRGHSK